MRTVEWYRTLHRVCRSRCFLYYGGNNTPKPVISPVLVFLTLTGVMWVENPLIDGFSLEKVQERYGFIAKRNKQKQKCYKMFQEKYPNAFYIKEEIEVEERPFYQIRGIPCRFCQAQCNPENIPYCPALRKYYQNF